MNSIYKLNQANWEELLQRPTDSMASIETTVLEVFNEVRLKGDSALAKYTSIFDGVSLE